VDLTFKAEGRQTLIKGAIMRNLFIPHKDIFLDFMDKIRNRENFNLAGNGHMLLSGCRDFFNKIIVSERMKIPSPGVYLNSTAGLDEIIYGVDEFLNKLLSPIELQKIEDIITNLKKTYAALEYDPIYPYSILQNVSKVLKSESPPLSLLESSSTSTSYSKKSILYSAESRISSFVGWPNEFPRVVKNEVKIRPAVIESTEDPYQNEIASIKDYREPLREQKEFKLRIDKSENVKVKSLPLPPTDDIEKILLYVKQVIEQDFDMPSIGRALGLARDSIKNLYPVEYSTIKWELSKWANIYEKKEHFLGLPIRDKEDLLKGVGKWLKEFEEERLEKERQEREEMERVERERLERERRQREMLEKEELQKERQRLEEERREREKLAALREEQERIKIQREQERLEAEKQQKLKSEQERLDKERQEREALEREKIELKELKAKKKKQAKLLKQKTKQEKKLEKQKAKLAKQKEKEKEELAKLTQKLESLEQ
jgi:chemotaxis protein histidine kinase CheA